MAKAIHMMIRVLEEARSVKFYVSAFDLGIKDRFDFDGFTLVYLKNPENDFEVELTINHGRTEAYTHGTRECATGIVRGTAAGAALLATITAAVAATRSSRPA